MGGRWNNKRRKTRVPSRIGRLASGALLMVALMPGVPAAGAASDVPDPAEFYGVRALVTDLVQPTELSLDPRTGSQEDVGTKP